MGSNVRFRSKQRPLSWDRKPRGATPWGVLIGFQPFDSGAGSYSGISIYITTTTRIALSIFASATGGKRPPCRQCREQRRSNEGRMIVGSRSAVPDDIKADFARVRSIKFTDAISGDYLLRAGIIEWLIGRERCWQPCCHDRDRGAGPCVGTRPRGWLFAERRPAMSIGY
jgi:hypothetical protein